MTGHRTRTQTEECGATVVPCTLPEIGWTYRLSWKIPRYRGHRCGKFQIMAVRSFSLWWSDIRKLLISVELKFHFLRSPTSSRIAHQGRFVCTRCARG